MAGSARNPVVAVLMPHCVESNLDELPVSSVGYRKLIKVDTLDKESIKIEVLKNNSILITGSPRAQSSEDLPNIITYFVKIPICYNATELKALYSERGWLCLQESEKNIEYNVNEENSLDENAITQGEHYQKNQSVPISHFCTKTNTVTPSLGYYRPKHHKNDLHGKCDPKALVSVHEDLTKKKVFGSNEKSLVADDSVDILSNTASTSISHNICPNSHQNALIPDKSIDLNQNVIPLDSHTGTNVNTLATTVHIKLGKATSSMRTHKAQSQNIVNPFLCTKVYKTTLLPNAYKEIIQKTLAFDRSIDKNTSYPDEHLEKNEDTFAQSNYEETNKKSLYSNLLKEKEEIVVASNTNVHNNQIYLPGLSNLHKNDSMEKLSGVSNSKPKVEKNQKADDPLETKCSTSGIRKHTGSKESGLNLDANTSKVHETMESNKEKNWSSKTFFGISIQKIQKTIIPSTYKRKKPGTSLLDIRSEKIEEKLVTDLDKNKDQEVLLSATRLDKRQKVLLPRLQISKNLSNLLRKFDMEKKQLPQPEADAKKEQQPIICSKDKEDQKGASVCKEDGVDSQQTALPQHLSESDTESWTWDFD